MFVHFQTTESEIFFSTLSHLIRSDCFMCCRTRISCFWKPVTAAGLEGLRFLTQGGQDRCPMQLKRAKTKYIHEHINKTVRQIGTACEALLFGSTPVDPPKIKQKGRRRPLPCGKIWGYVHSMLGRPYVFWYRP